MLQALRALSKLRVLDVTSNAITELQSMPALADLQDLWLEGNKLATWDTLLQSLSEARQLTCLTLQGNPACQLGNSRSLWQAVPSLQQLDQQTRPTAAVQ